MNKTLKIVLISFCVIAGIALIVFVGFSMLVDQVVGPGRHYSIAELTNSFNKKQKEIYDAERYFNSIVPRYKKIDIEFDEDGAIARLEVDPVDTGKGSDLTTEFLGWDLPATRADSILHVLGWTKNNLQTLKQKLDDADCISISSGDPMTIGFKRNGMGMYSFNTFDKPLPDSLKSRYNDSCTFIYVNNKLVLQYEGGAIGMQCFFSKPN